MTEECQLDPSHLIRAQAIVRIRTTVLLLLVHSQGSSEENISQQCSCLNAVSKTQHIWKYSVVKQASVQTNTLILLHSPPDQSQILSLGIAVKVIPSAATI